MDFIFVDFWREKSFKNPLIDSNERKITDSVIFNINYWSSRRMPMDSRHEIDYFETS